MIRLYKILGSKKLIKEVQPLKLNFIHLNPTDRKDPSENKNFHLILKIIVTLKTSFDGHYQKTPTSVAIKP